MTQKQMILEHLRKHKTLTSMEAFEQYGATRLAAVIFDLRKAGYDIDTMDVYGFNRYGEPTRYARYFFKGEAK